MSEREFIDLCRSHRLKPCRDTDGTVHVVGKRGDIYIHGDGRLAWCLFGPLATRGRKRIVLRDHVPHTLRVEQDGDEEMVFSFEPQHLPAIAKLARCKVRRVLSDQQRAECTVRLAAWRDSNAL